MPPKITKRGKKQKIGKEKQLKVNEADDKNGGHKGQQRVVKDQAGQKAGNVMKNKGNRINARFQEGEDVAEMTAQGHLTDFASDGDSDQDSQIPDCNQGLDQGESSVTGSDNEYVSSQDTVNLNSNRVVNRRSKE